MSARRSNRISLTVEALEDRQLLAIAIDTSALQAEIERMKQQAEILSASFGGMGVGHGQTTGVQDIFVARSPAKSSPHLFQQAGAQGKQPHVPFQGECLGLGQGPQHQGQQPAESPSQNFAKVKSDAVKK